MAAIAKFYERRNSTKMPAKSQQPPMIAYRDTNGQIQYVAAPNANLNQPTSSYDSDGEPLIPTDTQDRSDVDGEAIQRFTATGQPIAPIKQGALMSWGGDMYTPPKLLPKQYTDDSVIPAIVTNVTPRVKTEVEEASDGGGKRRKSFAKIFKSDKDKTKAGDGKGITKVVFMPRREYIKYFAKDNSGNYIGTEPAKQWTEEELDERFAEFKPKNDGKQHGELLGILATSYRSSTG